MEYKLWQVILYPHIFAILAFYCIQKLGWDWDTALFMFLSVFVGVVVAIHMIMHDFHLMMEDLIGQAPSIPVKVNGVSQGEIYPMTVELVTIDLEKRFLNQMKDLWYSGSDIDLREKYWLKQGNWKAMGGSSDKQWRDFMDSLEKRELIKRINPNAKNRNSKRKIVARKMKEYW